MTVQARARREAPPIPARPRHRLDWDTDPELARFAGLSREERTRVIIRVLCGLVALEDAGGAPPADQPGRTRRLLSFLHYEDTAPHPAPVAAPRGSFPLWNVDASLARPARPRQTVGA
jgi:hypothetical protein